MMIRLTVPYGKEQIQKAALKGALDKGVDRKRSYWMRDTVTPKPGSPKDLEVPEEWNWQDRRIRGWQSNPRACSPSRGSYYQRKFCLDSSWEANLSPSKAVTDNAMATYTASVCSVERPKSTMMLVRRKDINRQQVFDRRLEPRL